MQVDNLELHEFLTGYKGAKMEVASKIVCHSSLGKIIIINCVNKVCIVSVGMARLAYKSC